MWIIKVYKKGSRFVFGGILGGRQGREIRHGAGVVRSYLSTTHLLSALVATLFIHINNPDDVFQSLNLPVCERMRLMQLHAKIQSQED